MQRGALLALPMMLVIVSLTGCALFNRSSTLDDALETMPDYVTRVVFVDHGAVSEGLDVDRAPLPEDVPFSADDVEWEVTGSDGEGFGRVWKIDDDIDLDDVDEVVTFAVVPDAHLVVAGPLTDGVLSVVDDDHDSLVDSGSFDDLVDSTDDVEVADLSRADAVCSLGDSRLPPDQLAASDAAGLTRPHEAGFFVHGDDGRVRSVLRFGDSDKAEEAADEREELLADGTSPVSGVPYSEFGSYEVEADDEQVRIDIEYDEPTDVSAVLARRDYPSICLPE
jgi:hypothetical protein